MATKLNPLAGWEKNSLAIWAKMRLKHCLIITLLSIKGSGTGTDSGAGQLVSDYGNLPVIDPENLVGSTISSTQADLTAAAKNIGALDGLQFENTVPLRGGPFFPLQELYYDKKNWLGYKRR